MKKVLYDMQIAEAMVETNYEEFGTGEKRLAVYDGVFAKHNISQALYDSSLIWYGSNMNLYMSIYKLVLKDVNENIALLGDIAPNPLSGEVSAKDSIDIWILKRSFNFNPQRLFNVLSFDLSPKVPYSSGSSYVFGMSVWGVPYDNKPVIKLYAAHSDTTISTSKTIDEDGYVEATVKTIVDKQVRRVYGYVFFNDRNLYYNSVYLNNIRLMKYNYGSKAATAPQTDSIP
jgi:hypothetical protein